MVVVIECKSITTDLIDCICAEERIHDAQLRSQDVMHVMVLTEVEDGG